MKGATMAVDRREDPGEFYPDGKVISTRPIAGGGDMKHSDFADVEPLPERFTDEDVRRRLNQLVSAAKGASAAIAALLLGTAAFGAGVTVQTAPKGTIYNDEHIVTGVVFNATGLATPEMVTNIVQDVSPAPDFSTNNVELVKTIQAKAPAPDLSPFLRNDKNNNEVQTFGGMLSGFAFHADTGLNDNGWSQYTAHNGTALAQSLPTYIQSNPWGFLKLDDNNVLTVPTLTVGARAGGSTIGEISVAEGFEVTASGTSSHAEGDSTTAYGNSAHAEGLLSTAWGPNSHAEGYDTQTQNSGEHAQGRCNLSHTGANAADQTISSIGIGGGNRDRKNAVETMKDGKTFIYGLGGYDGTNPTNGVKDLVAAIGGKLDNTGLHNNGGTLRAVSFDTDGLFIFNGTMWLDVPATSGPALTAGDLENPDAPLYQTFNEKASKGDIPPTVSNIVTTALVRERLGVYLYVGEDGGIYVHTNED